MFYCSLSAQGAYYRLGNNSPEILPCLRPLAMTQVPDTYGVPADRVLWFPVHHLMREDEQLRV